LDNTSSSKTSAERTGGARRDHKSLCDDQRYASGGAAPDIPTFAEMGLPALSYSEWSGLFAPAGTPRDIIDRLNAAVVEALADPAVRARLVEFGAESFPRELQTPEALGAMVRADAEKWYHQGRRDQSGISNARRDNFPNRFVSSSTSRVRQR
jgi:hypothetical protein